MTIYNQGLVTAAGPVGKPAADGAIRARSAPQSPDRARLSTRAINRAMAALVR